MEKERRSNSREGLLVVLVEVGKTAYHDAVVNEVKVVYGVSPWLLCVVDLELGPVRSGLMVNATSHYLDVGRNPEIEVSLAW